MINPLPILNKAISKVPAVKYALAIAGVAAAIALIRKLAIDNYNIPFKPILIMLGLMVLMWVFAMIASSREKIIKTAGYILIYLAVALMIVWSFLVTSSVFFDYPKSINKYFTQADDLNKKDVSTHNGSASSSKPKQKHKDGLLKILILPFSDLGKKTFKNYPLIIREKLESLNEKDSIQAEITCLENFNYPATFNEKVKDSILKEEDADFLIWGNYISERAEDFLSISYYSKTWNQFNQLDPDLKQVSFVNFSKGAAQGNLEYLLYNIAGRINYRLYFKNYLSKGIVSPAPCISKAISLFNHILPLTTKKSRNDEIYAIIATCYFFSDSTKQSIFYYRKYLEMNKTDLYCRNNLSLAYYKDKNWKDCICEISKCVEASPTNALFRIQRGNLLYMNGELDKALADADIGIKYNPKASKLYSLRGKVHLAKQSYNQTIIDINTAFYLHDYSEGNYYNRAYALWITHDTNKAIDDANEAISMNPYDAKVYDLLGLIYMSKADAVKAIEYFDKSLNINFENREALFNRASAEFNLGNCDRAFEDIQQVERIGNNLNDKTLLKLKKQIEDCILNKRRA